MFLVLISICRNQYTIILLLIICIVYAFCSRGPAGSRACCQGCCVLSGYPLPGHSWGMEGMLIGTPAIGGALLPFGLWCGVLLSTHECSDVIGRLDLAFRHEHGSVFEMRKPWPCNNMFVMWCLLSLLAILF